MTFVFIDREKNRDQRSGIQIFRDLENISMIKHYKSDAKKVIPKKNTTERNSPYKTTNSQNWWYREARKFTENITEKK